LTSPPIRCKAQTINSNRGILTRRADGHTPRFGSLRVIVVIVVVAVVVGAINDVAVLAHVIDLV